MDNQFKIGDIVGIGDSPVMSIQDIAGDEARVAWFGGTELHDDYFPVCCLTRKSWIGDQS